MPTCKQAALAAFQSVAALRRDALSVFHHLCGARTVGDLSNHANCRKCAELAALQASEPRP